MPSPKVRQAKLRTSLLASSCNTVISGHALTMANRDKVKAYTKPIPPPTETPPSAAHATHQAVVQPRKAPPCQRMGSTSSRTVADNKQNPNSANQLHNEKSATQFRNALPKMPSPGSPDQPSGAVSVLHQVPATSTTNSSPASASRLPSRKKSWKIAAVR